MLAHLKNYTGSKKYTTVGVVGGGGDKYELWKANYDAGRGIFKENGKFRSSQF